ncbi:MAG: hypothetical protein K2W95_14425 [Candidatus Obscuribacterales bacterium]|nr:hypothetical protein [Candidatus Obscuribacterales bacterium]
MDEATKGLLVMLGVCGLLGLAGYAFGRYVIDMATAEAVFAMGVGKPDAEPTAFHKLTPPIILRRDCTIRKVDTCAELKE